MAVVGGSIDQVSLAGRSFAVAADNEATLNTGGKNNENQANGNGTARMVKTTVLAGVQGLQIEIDDARDDHAYIQGLADSSDYFPVDITLASGEVWYGDLQIEGEFGRSTQSSLLSINLMGPALTKL